MTKATQYSRILDFLRKNGQGTVSQLSRASGSNYVSRRLYEMTSLSGCVLPEFGGLHGPGLFETERYLEQILRLWTTTRSGQKIRLYKLIRNK